MIKLEIYNPEKTYMTPDMKIATPDSIKANYSAVNNFKCVIYTDEEGEIFSAIEPFNAMRSRLNVEKGLSDEDTLLLMEDIINNPPVVESEPTAEERIASQLELQNMLAMPDDL